MKNKKSIIIFTAIIILVILEIINIENIILKKLYPIKYEDYVLKYSKEYNVDKNLIFAIIKAESNFKNESISESNAKGLMQIMDLTANELAENLEIENEIDLFDEETNIKLGTYYISTLLKYYNNTYLALSAYNAGIGNVNKWIEEGIIERDGSNIENIPFKETRNYIRNVIRNYKIYLMRSEE